MPEAKGRRGEAFRQWLESLAKIIAAVAAGIAIVSAAVIGANYQSKITSISLLSQREDAESRIRSSMFQSLVEPVIRLSPENTVDPNRYHVLVNLLTLNFHDQFEVKPLLEDADRILADQNVPSGRRSLRSVARRVIDRQITSLSGSSEAAYGVPTTAKIFFFSPIVSDKAVPEPCQSGTNSRFPAQLTGGVCLVSDDGKYHLKISLKSPDFETKTVGVGIRICRKKPPCIEEKDIVRGFSFTLTSFDFPLTDNTQIDADHRFAVSLYSMKDKNWPIIIKFVWFPPGFVTARERPMNYLTLRKALE